MRGSVFAAWDLLVAVRGLGVGWVSDLFEVSALSKQSFCPSAPNSGPKHGKTVKSEKRILPFTLLRFYAFTLLRRKKRFYGFTLLPFYAPKTVLRFYAFTLLRSRQSCTILRFYSFTLLRFYTAASGGSRRAGEGKTVKPETRILPFTLLRFYAATNIVSGRAGDGKTVKSEKRILPFTLLHISKGR